jgi:hypothetical protein
MIMTVIEPATWESELILKYTDTHLGHKIKGNIIQNFPKKKCTLLPGNYANTGNLQRISNDRVKLLYTVKIKIFCSLNRI